MCNSGCVRRHMGEGQLTATLGKMMSDMKIESSSTHVSDMIKLTKGGHYGLACQKHFDLTHPGASKLDIKGSVRCVIFHLITSFKGPFDNVLAGMIG